MTATLSPPVLMLPYPEFPVAQGFGADPSPTVPFDVLMARYGLDAALSNFSQQRAANRAAQDAYQVALDQFAYQSATGELPTGEVNATATGAVSGGVIVPDGTTGLAKVVPLASVQVLTRDRGYSATETDYQTAADAANAGKFTLAQLATAFGGDYTVARAALALDHQKDLDNPARVVFKKRLATARAKQLWKALFWGQDPGFDITLLTKAELSYYLRIRSDKHDAQQRAALLQSLDYVAKGLAFIPVLGGLLYGISSAAGALLSGLASEVGSIGGGAGGLLTGNTLIVPNFLVPSAEVITAQNAQETRAGAIDLGKATVNTAASVVGAAVVTPALQGASTLENVAGQVGFKALTVGANLGLTEAALLNAEPRKTPTNQVAPKPRPIAAPLAPVKRTAPVAKLYPNYLPQSVQDVASQAQAALPAGVGASVTQASDSLGGFAPTENLGDTQLVTASAAPANDNTKLLFFAAVLIGGYLLLKGR